MTFLFKSFEEMYSWLLTNLKKETGLYVKISKKSLKSVLILLVILIQLMLLYVLVGLILPYVI